MDTQSMRDELNSLVHSLRAQLEWARELGVEEFGLQRTGDGPADLRPDRPITLDEIRERIGECTRCRLHESRTNLVFGSGNQAAELVFVGEGPGREEDLQGVPFVGDAGQLLGRIIAAMGLAREDVYICNVVKCRPPKNRNPEPDEVESCIGFLEMQIQSVNPKVIVALGKFAAHALLRTVVPISKLRGKWHDYLGIRVMPTFHPAYLLRNPADKRLVWEDMQEVMRLLVKHQPLDGR